MFSIGLGYSSSLEFFLLKQPKIYYGLTSLGRDNRNSTTVLVSFTVQPHSADAVA